MKNKIRGILLFILVAICMTMGITANAQSVINEDGIVNIVYSNENSSEAIAELKLIDSIEPGLSLYGQYLSYGSSSINNVGNGKVEFTGNTMCYRESDVVVVAVSLQRLVGSNWQTYATRTGVSNNARSASVGDTVTVPKGYTYRVKGVHTAQKGSTVDSVTTYTDGVYIY